MIRLLIILVSFQFFLNSAWADVKRPETLKDTLAIQLKALKADPRISDVRIVVKDNSINFKLDGTDIGMFPDNLHVQLQNASSDAERQELLDEFINGALQWVGKDKEVSSVNVSNVLPVIRHTETFENIGADAPFSVPFVGKMRVYFVEDTTDSMKFVQTDKLAELKLTKAQLFDRAKKNQKARKWKPKIRGNGVYYIILDGTYESSLLFNDTLWNDIEEVMGPVVVSVPNRDILLFARKNDAEDRARMLDISKSSYSDGNYRISDELMIRTKDGWELLSKP